MEGDKTSDSVSENRHGFEQQGLSKQDRHNADVHRISNVAIESLHNQGSRRIHRRKSASAPRGKIPYTTKKYVATRSHREKSTDLRQTETLNHDAALKDEVVGNRHRHRSRTVQKFDRVEIA